jgi:hypothetical protein
LHVNPAVVAAKKGDGSYGVRHDNRRPHLAAAAEEEDEEEAALSLSWEAQEPSE